MRQEDQARLRNKSAANRLGFALLLKFFEAETRFFDSAEEISGVGGGVCRPAGEGRCRVVGRVRLDGAGDQSAPNGNRSAFGFRECTTDDQARLSEWPADELCGVELNRDRLAQAVVARCRNERPEPPAPAKVARLVASAVNRFEENAAGRGSRCRRCPSG